jgi:flavin-dependent dehydrogenase
MDEIFPSMADVLVAGAGVAGTATAILLAKGGLSVVLLERRDDIEDYKSLCTHFVQPVANTVFADLGLSRLLEPAYSVRTKAAFLVPGGSIDIDGGYSDDPVTAYAHNIERRIFDPELRRQALACGVILAMGSSLHTLQKTPDGFSAEVVKSSGEKVSLSFRFVIAADGRGSALGRFLEAPTQTHSNDRAAYFCYCKGIAAPQSGKSIFSLCGNEMAFLYPQIEGRTLLSIYVKQERLAHLGHDGELFAFVLQKMKNHLPDVDFADATLDGRVYGYKKYDNQLRPPVTGQVAFVGDAAISIDPMSGVGCSFALKSARLLADAVLAHVGSRTDAMAAYAASHQQFFSAHCDGIIADSRVAKTDSAVSETYRHILADEQLQRSYLALTARLITPAQFQKRYLLSVGRRRSSLSLTTADVP